MEKETSEEEAIEFLKKSDILAQKIWNFLQKNVEDDREVLAAANLFLCQLCIRSGVSFEDFISSISTTWRMCKGILEDKKDEWYEKN